jgi:hypothetical protein
MINVSKKIRNWKIADYKLKNWNIFYLPPFGGGLRGRILCFPPSVTELADTKGGTIRLI